MDVFRAPNIRGFVPDLSANQDETEKEGNKRHEPRDSHVVKKTTLSLKSGTRADQQPTQDNAGLVTSLAPREARPDHCRWGSPGLGFRAPETSTLVHLGR